MLNERRDRRMHPFVQRQIAQESVKFRQAVGSIEAKDRRSVGADGGLPQPDEVSLVGQALCRGSFGPLAVFDFGLGNTVRDIQLELDEKLHHRSASCGLRRPFSRLPVGSDGGLGARQGVFQSSAVTRPFEHDRPLDEPQLPSGSSKEQNDP